MPNWSKFTKCFVVAAGLMTSVAHAEETVVWWDFLSGGDGVRMKQLLSDFNAQQRPLQRSRSVDSRPARQWDDRGCNGHGCELLRGRCGRKRCLVLVHSERCVGDSELHRLRLLDERVV